MSIAILFKALVIGFAIAAPVGPIGMLCIRKTLELGFVAGLYIGIGAALADASYGLLAAIGLDVVTNYLIDKTTYIQFFGGLFLLYLGGKDLLAKTSSHNIKLKKNHSMIVSTYILTISNPMTILTFLGVFASIAGTKFTGIDALITVIGVFIGSLIWWLILAALVTKLKHLLPESFINFVKMASAVIIILFGVYSINSSVMVI